MAVDPYGRWLASADGTVVQIWDGNTRQLLREFTADDVVDGLAAGRPDGWLAAVGRSGAIRICRPMTGETLHVLRPHREGVETDDDRVGRRPEAWLPPVVLATDGKGRWLAAADQTGVIHIWELATGIERHELAGHDSAVHAMVIAPDGTWLAAADAYQWGGDVVVWDLATGTVRHRLTGHVEAADSLAVPSDGSWLASASQDGTVRVWNPCGEATRHTVAGHTDWVRTLVSAPDGSWVASGGDDGTVRLWDPRSGNELRCLRGHSDWIWDLTVATDGSWLASRTYSGRVVVWDPIAGSSVCTLTDRTAALVGTSGVRWLAVVETAEAVSIWDPRVGTELHTLRVLGASRATCLSLNGSLLALTDDRRGVQVWDPETGESVRHLAGQPGTIAQLAGPPDGRWLATLAEGGIITIWDPRTGAALRTLGGQTGATSVLVGPDGSWFASRDADRRLRFWLPHAGWSAGAVVEDVGQVFAIAPSGRYIAWSEGDHADAVDVSRVVRVVDVAGQKAGAMRLGTNVRTLLWAHDVLVVGGERGPYFLRWTDSGAACDEAPAGRRAAEQP